MRPPQESSVIHFGASIPGETIDRTGRLPIDALLENMVQKKASDLHLTLAQPACVRIDGEIVRMGEGTLTEDQMRSYLLPIMPPKNREEFARICDTDFSYEVPGLARFRVNVFRNRMGVGAVLRQIPDKILSADDLGLPPAIRKLCDLHKGLVVVTGPTGSGKSTTLAAMVDLINESRSEHILTIEDPIEFVHQQKRCLVNQREVHKHTQSFSRALRAALREDPDIILIGEMRDLETVEIAIETAETGHLVFGTLHTNTAISTVDRLIDQFPAEQQEQVRVMLAESLKGVVAQTLVKKKGGGRVAAQEILIVDKAVSSLIREGNTHMVQNHMQTQKAKGNCTLNDALLNLVTKGVVDARDAYAKSVEKEAFANMLQQKGITLDPTVKTA
jgi:twitching motility protein PilT